MRDFGAVVCIVVWTVGCIVVGALVRGGPAETRKVDDLCFALDGLAGTVAGAAAHIEDYDEYQRALLAVVGAARILYDEHCGEPGIAA